MPSNKDGLSEQPLDLTIPFPQVVRQLVQSLPSVFRTSLLRPPRLSAALGTVNSYLRWGFTPAGLLESAAAAYPRREAIIDDVSRLSYAELREAARGFAGALHHAGLSEGDRLAVIARNSRVPVIALAACNYLGLVPLVMNPMSSAGQLQRTAQEYGAAAVFVDVDYAEGFQDVEVPIFLGFGAEDGVPDTLNRADFAGTLYSYVEAISAGRGVKLPYHPHQLPTVIMSSGTSGRPKGVVRAVPKSPQVLQSIFPKVPWRVGGVIQLTASLYHAWGWLNLNLIFATASAMVMRRNFDGQQAMDDINRYGVTGIISAAVFLRDLVGIEGPERRTVEFIVSSGNAIPPHLVHEINAKFGVVTCNFYGSTEHGPIAVAGAEELEEDPKRAGTVAAGVHTAILDDEGHEVPTGTVGTIYSANTESMVGYLSAKDKSEVRDHMLCTGDLGHFDEAGYLYVHGRSDDMVIKGGENVYPRELEELLAKQPEVADVFVKGIRGEIISTVNCYLVPAEGAAIDDAFVKNLVTANLAEQNQPDNIFWLDKLPRNDAGKVVPRFLPQPED